MNMVHCEASLLEVSRLMRECGTAELVVVTETGGKPCTLGIVTANDIVTRVVALDLDPSVLTAGDIARFAAH